MHPGLYDHLLTTWIEAEIARLGDPRLAELVPLDPEESHSALAQFVERLIATKLSHYRGADAAEKQRLIVERVIAALAEESQSQTNSVQVSLAPCNVSWLSI